MPNHTFNKLTFQADEPEQLAAIRDAIKGDENHPLIDFDRIIPMPELIKNTGSGGRTFEVNGEKVNARSWYQNGGEERPFTDAELAELAEIGSDNWYDWSCANWGTKWNAYDQREIEADEHYWVISFDTAWSPPQPIVDALREKFPDVYIRGHFVGEGDEYAGTFE